MYVIYVTKKTSSAASRFRKVDKVVNESFQYLVCLTWDRFKSFVNSIRHLVSHLLLMFASDTAKRDVNYFFIINHFPQKWIAFPCLHFSRHPQ